MTRGAPFGQMQASRNHPVPPRAVVARGVQRLKGYSMPVQETSFAAHRQIGKTRSLPRLYCGTKHGMEGTKTYRAWSSMKVRCLNKNSENYARYGGRGIKVCERWMSFVNFLQDMGVAPQSMTLERNNVNGDYEPGNCRWADITEQNNNKTSNILITAFNETKTASMWAQDPRCFVSYAGLVKRILNGWPHLKAIAHPMKVMKNNRPLHLSAGQNSVYHGRKAQAWAPARIA